jgi:hypothetical protein
MATLNKSETAIVKSAVRDHAKKLQLEKGAKLQVGGFLKRVRVEMQQELLQTGGVLDVSDRMRELQGIILNQYSRAQKQFSFEIMTFLKTKVSKSQREMGKVADALGETYSQLLARMKKEIAYDAETFKVINAIEDSISILSTTQKQVTKSIAKAEAELQSEGFAKPTNKRLAARAGKIFDQASRSRKKTIATTTIQRGAEGTKQVERDLVLEVRNNKAIRKQTGLDLKELEPTWITMADDLVREEHLQADFQQRTKGYFKVWNEKLRFPGDTSLGASAKNIVNCRCAAVTSME